MKHQFLQQNRAATVRFSYNGTEAHQCEKSMDPYNASALKLQENLLNLRLERDRLKKEGKHNEADELAELIAKIEAAIQQLPDSFKPVTLQ